MNWELIGEVADNVKADRGKALKVAFEEEARGRAPVPQHRLGPGTVDRVARGCRLSFLHSRKKDEKTAIGAAGGKQSRGHMAEG